MNRQIVAGTKVTRGTGEFVKSSTQLANGHSTRGYVIEIVGERAHVQWTHSYRGFPLTNPKKSWIKLSAITYYCDLDDVPEGC